MSAGCHPTLVKRFLTNCSCGIEVLFLLESPLNEELLEYVSHFRCCAPDSPAKAKLSCQFSWPSKVKLTFWTEEKSRKKTKQNPSESQLVQFAAEQLSWRLERGDKSQGAKKGAVLYVLMSNFKGLQMPPGVLHSVSNVAVFGIK